MATAAIVERARIEGWSDEEVVDRVRAGDTALFEVIMRRYNQRLYRVARAILRNDSEAEDVIQDAYVRAYQHLDQFEGRARFSTWLTRIAVHEALARAHRLGRLQSLDSVEELHSPGSPARGGVARSGMDGEVTMRSATLDPEQYASAAEAARLLEQAILALPDHYRTVLVCRDVEEMTTAEAAAALDLTEENVKVRLHRARALLRKELYARAGATSSAAFQFHATRCDRVVQNVFARLAAATS